MLKRARSWDANGVTVMVSAPRRSASSKPNETLSAINPSTVVECGMNVSDTHCLKSFEDENAKLKHLLADAMLDNVDGKELTVSH